MWVREDKATAEYRPGALQPAELLTDRVGKCVRRRERNSPGTILPETVTALLDTMGTAIEGLLASSRLFFVALLLSVSSLSPAILSVTGASWGDVITSAPIVKAMSGLKGWKSRHTGTIQEPLWFFLVGPATGGRTSPGPPPRVGPDPREPTTSPRIMGRRLRALFRGWGTGRAPN